MSRVKAKAFSARSALYLLWATVVVGVVAWAGCKSSVITSSTNASGGSSAAGGSGAGGVCNVGPDCADFQGPDTPCTVPGECCSYLQCDHMGGVSTVDLVCSDAGVFQ